MTVRYSKRVLLIFAAALTLIWAHTPAKAGNPFDKLSGDWTGEGTVKLNNGNVKTVTCKVNYKVAGSDLTQRLHCNGDDYEVEVTLKLADEDGRVKGKWNEGTEGASGE